MTVSESPTLDSLPVLHETVEVSRIQLDWRSCLKTARNETSEHPFRCLLGRRFMFARRNECRFDMVLHCELRTDCRHRRL